MVVSKNAWFRRIAAVRSRPVLVRHAAPFGRWQGPDLSIAVLSDLHVAAPFTSLALIRRIGHAVTAMAPDMIVLAGDFLADGVMAGRHATARQIVDALDVLQAPLGVFAILGNHDWQDCPIARASRYQENSVAQAFHGHRIRLLRNQGVQLAQKGHDFNVVGFDSQRPVPKTGASGCTALRQPSPTSRPRNRRFFWRMSPTTLPRMMTARPCKSVAIRMAGS